MENWDVICVLCKNDLKNEAVVNVRQKGLNTLVQSSLQRGDGIHKQIEEKDSIQVHVKCRQNYTRPSSIKSAITRAPKEEDHAVPSTSTRLSAADAFDFKTNCFICGETALISNKVPVDRRDVRFVATLELKEKFLKKCDDRNDEWGEKVKARLLNINDLVAPEARYHKICHRNFSTIGKTSTGKHKQNEEYFSKLFDLIDESDECQFTVKELKDEFVKISNETETMSGEWIKSRLKKHYGDRIIFSNISGRKNVVCLSDTANKIIDSWYKDRENDQQSERLRIIKTAADIIKEDVQKMVYDTKSYPPVHEMASESLRVIPESLAVFSEQLTKKRGLSERENIKRKRVIINHAIISAIRPRSFLSCIQVGLGLTLHRLFGSKHLIDMLHSMGICASYNETSVYLNSLINAGPPEIEKEVFVQHVFDNADVNVRTLDALNTFHAMGGIQCITPKNCVRTQTNVERITTGVFSGDIIRVKVYAKAKSREGLKSISVTGYSDLKTRLNIEGDFTSSSLFPLNTIWLAGVNTQPGWNGFMQIISQGNDFESTYIMALPFINMDASNMSTIFSALSFASEQSRKQKQSCIVTFDQPLYLKASEIVASADKDSDVAKIILRLGGFHLLMSFMGSVGLIMEDSGLENLWATVYGSNTVQNMMKGHAYSRCIRAYALTASAVLNTLIEENAVLKKDIETLDKFNKNLIGNEMKLQDALTAKEVIESCDRINESLKSIENSSRTGKLWISLLKCIDLILQFIYAERTGDWEMHLKTVAKMLPFFHSAGHLPYAKSAHLYVQQMVNIETKLSEREYELFVRKGMFTVRRNNKFWSGTWTDMCIEQSLMRPMKSVGGLTHGRGITENTLQKWIHGTPFFLKVHEAIEELLGTTMVFSEQHVEMRESRKSRDKKDLDKFTEWLKGHNPFTKYSGELISLASGYVSDDSVNCDKAFELGIKAMEKMEGKNFGDLQLQRKDKVITQGKPKQVKIRSHEATINPQQLFNRILCICDSPLKLKDYLSYELAARPPSIFDDFSLRKGTKSSLLKIFDFGVEDLFACTQYDYVVDGGFLIHYVKWPESCTFGDIVNNYCEYTISNYGQGVMVIFDGYPEHPTTKNVEQTRRMSKKTSCDIEFTNTTRCTIPKENFLGNQNNKKKLIQQVELELNKRGVKTLVCEDDADCDIVKTALHKSDENKEVVVVGTDTDLLVMLVALASPTCKLYFLKPHGGQTKVYNVQKLVEHLSDIRGTLLFAHAMTGCDTTSCFYGLGKLKAIEVIKSSSELRDHALVFMDKDVAKDKLLISGERFVLGLYGLDRYNSLNEARYFKFTSMTKKAALRSNFDLARLPPTTEACQQHILRVYHQVQWWLGNGLLPTQWGWRLENSGVKHVLTPIMSLKTFAPNDLMKLVSCSCKQACGNYCGCRKLGLHCSNMCEHCNGLSCHNVGVIESIDNDEDLLEDV